MFTECFIVCGHCWNRTFNYIIVFIIYICLWNIWMICLDIHWNDIIVVCDYYSLCHSVQTLYNSTTVIHSKTLFDWHSKKIMNTDEFVSKLETIAHMTVYQLGNLASSISTLCTNNLFRGIRWLMCIKLYFFVA